MVPPWTQEDIEAPREVQCMLSIRLGNALRCNDATLRCTSRVVTRCSSLALAHTQEGGPGRNDLNLALGLFFITDTLLPAHLSSSISFQYCIQFHSFHAKENKCQHERKQFIISYLLGGMRGQGGGIRISVCLGWMNPQDGLECVFQPAPPILKQNDDAALIQNCFHSQLKIWFLENM